MGGDLCAVCSNAIPKYKCPNCKIRYCSINCFKVHKTELCLAPEPQTASSVSTAGTSAAHLVKPKSSNNARSNDIDDDEEEAKHRLTFEDLQELNNSEQLKRLLMNPNIRAMLEAVHKTQDPMDAIRVLRQRSDFEELVQALIQASGGNNSNKK
ncbi:Zinc finger HIT domain-containing protein 3 [Coemansia umbellata]|uniref:Zinc finger HIT domain-containing protein 3 n=1 Tax=Coemansia umbellata TaxID=1424467 RepID=A0ABQ8PEE7_9FUNG|nr:Zinc finger HIT domain-containing protein 3 [Coemansia umbellata]